ncbi:unnamed protein product [Pylaiella littoralis]
MPIWCRLKPKCGVSHGQSRKDLACLVASSLSHNFIHTKTKTVTNVYSNHRVDTPFENLELCAPPAFEPKLDSKKKGSEIRVPSRFRPRKLRHPRKKQGFAILLIPCTRRLGEW